MRIAFLFAVRTGVQPPLPQALLDPHHLVQLCILVGLGTYHGTAPRTVPYPQRNGTPKARDDRADRRIYRIAGQALG